MENQQPAHQPGSVTNPHMPPPAVGNDTNANNKRAALAGQWRTPPIPTFPSGNPAGTVPVAPKPPQTVAPPPPQQPPATQQPAAQQKQVDISQLPDSTEDYAKALQEAYRRGAEAAQAMAAAAAGQAQGGAPPATTTTTPTIASTASTNLQPQRPGTVMPPPKVEKPTVAPAANQTIKPSPSAPHIVPHTGRPGAMHNPAPPMQTAVPNPLSMPPPSSMTPIAPTTQSSVPVPMPNTLGAPPPMGMVKPVAGAMMPPQAQRSMSLPDMSSYAAQQEEEKRQKRLARNRASARLRRLRKKNLVEAYEQEVGILEKTLAQLQAHEWGETDNVAALTEALSMDRGQQVLSYKQRHEAATNLLDQQLQWIEMLEEIMMEDYVLQNVRSGEFAELRDILGLDEEQLNQIEMSKVGWEEEWAALQTLKASITAMRENDWLWNESVSGIAEQFMSILHKNQVSKFLLWADHNAEAIDELDGVNAYPGTPNGPVFTFGVENQPDEEK